MAAAFILANCELGSEKQVITDLKSICCVKKVHGVFGAYDLMIGLECKRLEELRQTIISEVRRIKNVRSTITLIGIEGRVRKS